MPGGTDLLVACGFRVRVIEFEEHWEHTPAEAAASSILREAREALEKYRQIIASRQEAAAKARADRLAGQDAARRQTLSNIEEDKAERKDRVWVREGEGVKRRHEQGALGGDADGPESQ